MFQMGTRSSDAQYYSLSYLNSHPHLLAVYPVLTNHQITTESQRYNCFIRNGGNAVPKHAGPEAKSSNPIAGLNCEPTQWKF